ncbi:hypothetical protein DPEC_G00298660 [Dallia pectoralis]|uniref:Uncharacterized protein n=1 Tax=Dallia pectoralis TaxID=75939 RepID=A0ACC2FFT8_DALPE|nr:hypothetical protein DPEC_G00298660 [Dallia pectoralis]
MFVVHGSHGNSDVIVAMLVGFLGKAQLGQQRKTDLWYGRIIGIVNGLSPWTKASRGLFKAACWAEQSRYSQLARGILHCTRRGELRRSISLWDFRSEHLDCSRLDPKSSPSEVHGLWNTEAGGVWREQLSGGHKRR